MKLWSRTTPLRPLTSSALMRPSNSHAKTIAPVARYYRLQEQEDALLAIAAARDDCDSAD